MTRVTRDDVVAAAGRLFATYGYHGTSMRDLGRELGLLGSSLYSHIDSKEDLLVEVVERGAVWFERAAEEAVSSTGDPAEMVRAFIRGHVDVVLDHLDEVRTFLNEASALAPERRAAVIAARDRYEQHLRDALRAGVDAGAFRPDLDVRLTSIFILSVLNAIERWYRPEGRLDRDDLAAAIWRFIAPALRAVP